MHAASLNACPIAVGLPVLYVVALVFVVLVLAVTVGAVCMRFFHLANSNRCPKPYILGCLYTIKHTYYSVEVVHGASTCTASDSSVRTKYYWQWQQQSCHAPTRGTAWLLDLSVDHEVVCVV